MTEKREEGQQQEKRTAEASTSPLLLRGEIIFDNKIVKSFTGATVYVRLEDVTMQDAPSKLILQQVIKDISYDAIAAHHLQKKIEFELLGDIEIIDLQSTYAVSVHIDVDNNGEINSGDFINMESFPVITHGYPKDKISIHVRQITK
jgi:uncharacterized lipoprotein YbaY